MKTPTLSLFALILGIAPLKAQVFQPNVLNGALVGSVAGAIIGNNSGHHTAEGALIGAVGGAALGSLVQSRPAPVYYTQPAAPVYYAPPPPVYYVQPAPVAYAPPTRVVIEETPPPAVCPAPVYYRYGWGRPWGYRSWGYYEGPSVGISFGFHDGWGHRDWDHDHDRGRRYWHR